MSYPTYDPMSGTRTAGPHPMLTIHYQDPHEGWEGILVVDRLVNGCAIGGCRMTETVTLEEVVRLARGMTRKNRMLDLGIGGGKTGIRYDPTSPHKKRILKTFFSYVRSVVESMYGFGPDMNTSGQEMDEIAEAVGLQWRLQAAARGDVEGARHRYDSALALPWGPFTVGAGRTGYGAAVAAATAVDFLDMQAPLRVSVHGFGHVGSGAAWELTNRGHVITCVADEGGAYFSPDGFAVESVLASKGGPRAHIQLDGLGPGVTCGQPMDALFTDCDILVLAAIPDVITVDNAHAVKARIVVEPANISVMPEAAEALYQRGTIVIPDYIASAAAITLAAGTIQGWLCHDDTERLLQQLGDKMANVTHRALVASHHTQSPIHRSFTPDLAVYDPSGIITIPP